MAANTREHWRLLFRPSFVVCALILIATAVGDGLLADLLTVVVEKKPLHLQNSLSTLDRDALGPYRFVRAKRVSSDMDTALGANDYIFWILEDTSISSRKDPTRFAELAITYYTGKPDQRPHTPDICLPANGYDTKMPHETRQIHISTLPPDQAEIPVRVLTFVKSSVFSGDEPSVVYTFHCNGRFVVDKIKLMRTLRGRHNRHEYYCKVEVSFSDGMEPLQFAGREETVGAARKLFEHLLPLLLDRHFPDWEAAEAAVDPGTMDES
ncbi:MAG: hypothetical protein IID37_02945 [Planctomycetes bacterium]|nr:hypothetical protein [Planctomycetota bacterium]